MNNLRILSLLPAATEIVYLLGLQKYLVGVSHECDWPPQVKKKPKVTFSKISNAMSSREINERVKNLVHRGPARLAEDGESRRGVFHIKKGILKKLRPNLILTQELCEVCAVGFNQARQAARILDGEVKIISLEPESVDDILENIRVVGEFGVKQKEAIRVVRELRERLEKIQKRLLPPRRARVRNDGTGRPKVCVVEWLDPIMIAGHWIPEMVNLAGGVNLISKSKEKSKGIKLNQIRLSKLDVLIISPCGFDIQRTIKEKELVERIVRSIQGVYLIDGNAFMTRPGPRIVDGVEILAEILHPKIFKRKHSKKDWDILNI